MYKLVQIQMTERWRRLIDRHLAVPDQLDRWSATLALTQPAPRPHLRPTKTVVQLIKQHYEVIVEEDEI